MNAVWDSLALHYGRRAVLDLHISDGEVDEVTDEQSRYVIPLLAKQLKGDERICLDYGCGSGRWTQHLAALFPIAAGYDPSAEMIKLAAGAPDCPWYFSDRDRLGDFYGTVDALFCWVVLGGILEDEGEMLKAVCNIVNLTKPGGLIFFADHMDPPGHETWWQFRPMNFYARLFADFAIPLRRIGQCRQLAHTVTIMAGRKP